MGRKIILNDGGTAEREVDVDLIVVPDLWHPAMRVKHCVELPASDSAMILETWHLCHDLLKALQGPAPDIGA